MSTLVPYTTLFRSDSGDPDSEFSPNEPGTISLNGDFGDVLDGSETHTVTVDIPDGFAVVTPSGNLLATGTAVDLLFGDLPADVTAVIVDSDAADGTFEVVFTALVADPSGVSGFNYAFQVEAPEVIQDGTVFPFVATALAVENPTDPTTDRKSVV